MLKQSIAQFITQRDSLSSNIQHIFVGNGATELINKAISMISIGPETGFLVPVPQYPLFSAEITLNNCQFLGYHLDEEKNWSLDIEALQQSVINAKRDGINLRAIVIINPGNPTGNVFDKASLEKLFTFAFENNLVVLADEVYQENTYKETKPFISAKKVLSGMPPHISSSVELMSFHSASKGMLGEGGVRAGYVEMVNIHDEALA